ncbi:hypothetical protein CTAYLR_003175 [Chrysophaeum taylorii]|uniref:ABC transporter n=1 Tax=Chrysophaeum taylorii TaxID=2483200 RepID=A0AAD7XMV6_9STRA|nr:hypothetical protein CTAYLR_003175 [Chrysophaeum taylorii]
MEGRSKRGVDAVRVLGVMIFVVDVISLGARESSLDGPQYAGRIDDALILSGLLALLSVAVPRVGAVSGGLGGAYLVVKTALRGHLSGTLWFAVCSALVLSAAQVATVSGARRRKSGPLLRDYEAPLVEEEGTTTRTHGSLSLRRLVWLLKPYFWPRSATGRVSVVSTLGFVSLSKAANVVAPLLLARAANHLDDRSSFAWIGGYAALSFANKLLKECQSLAYLRVQKYAFVDLSTDTFAHLHSLSLQWYLSKKMGEVVRVMDRGISGCDTLMKYGVLYVVPSCAEALAVCVLFFTHFDLWELSVLILGSVASYAGLTIKLTLWRKRFRSRMNASDNQWHDRLVDSLVNFETVKYFTAEEYETRRFGESIANYQQSSVSVQASLSLLNIIQQVILCGCLAGSLILTARAVSRGRTSVGAFVAINVWVVNLFSPLNFLGTVYNSLVTALVDLRNLSELLAQKPETRNDENAIPHPNLNRGGGLAVEFRDVFFGYPKRGDMCLNGVSFAIAPGASLGIVGPTGAGKSTIGRLIFRFFDVSGGSVSVGSIDVRKVTQKSLRTLLGVVPQDTVLFNDTIAYNVAYGGGTGDVRDAAERANLADFIRSLPDGYETLVGERGLKLSGGEKQRVAIARLFVKNPPICLFDEATSALDSKTERSIQAALSDLAKARTSLTIAHRLGSIRNCDNILVLKGGGVLEYGTHPTLLALDGEYAAMWRAQVETQQEEEKIQPPQPHDI